MKLDDEQYLLLKQRYPIGHKFWAKVKIIKPFGIFVEVDDFPKDKDKRVGLDRCVGLIDIGHIALYKKGSQQLPRDYTQWPKEGTYINCMVCYYRDSSNECIKYIQIGLSWLGEITQSRPDR